MNRHNSIGLALCVLLGFLTHYYYVIYVVAIFAVMFVAMRRKKKIADLRKYLILHIGIGLVGILLYPACIQHVFFGYRGISRVKGGLDLWRWIIYWICFVSTEIVIAIPILFCLAFLF